MQVTDTNDNPPVFLEPAYSFDIPENALRGSRVGQIKATDSDLGVNAQLTYSVISDWANDVFSLNPQTGVFTLTSKLDYEEVRNILLTQKLLKLHSNCILTGRFDWFQKNFALNVRNIICKTLLRDLCDFVLSTVSLFNPA